MKQLAWTVARRQGSKLLRTFWKAIVVSALILIVTPIGLTVIAFFALANQLAGGGAFVTGYADGLAGSIACPVAGAVVTQGFGPTSAPFEPPGFGYPHFHTGVDLAAPIGTPVRAANDGFVEAAGTEVDALGIPVGFGNYIKVAVGGSEEEIYGHLSAIFVRPNQIVRAGEVIGAVGSTGSSTGPHLHFEVRTHGVPVDPSPALQC
ncbi:MAG: M23 family metallopeptidase [Candidatus Dormibacteraeota bacterium]|nr:M23 family metallopeptidase [Candidatus Dormibacteraeota bacterium]